MNDKSVIVVKDVIKKFRVHHDKSNTLKERILFRNRSNYEDRWVLRGINLEIRKGETVGLIGENGSGKSTLLKLLTRIMYPDGGKIEITGKVSSLLELGAGFHPDMTGRENIYINASIFGLTKREIDKKIDEIIAFSELNKFIDNPVRTYSSGMYMRLAFSVAVNVEADILLIDEILAVGDVNFQKKCFDKIKDLKKQGVTIVLVSHDMLSVERTCSKVVWIESGKVKLVGEPYYLANEYLEFMSNKDTNQILQSTINTAPEVLDISNNKDNKRRWGRGDIIFKDVTLIDEKDKSKSKFKTGEKFIVLFKYERINKEINSPVIGIGIFRNDGISCYGTNTQIDRLTNLKIKDNGEIRCVIEELNLIEGHYLIDIAIHGEDGFPYDYVRGAIEFDVYSEIKDVGITRLKHVWEIDKV